LAAAAATPTQEDTDDGIADRILPSPEDLLLPEEEQELISGHIIPWLDNNGFTLSNDGTFYSDSIIPPIVQQWLIRRGARLATAPPSVDPTATVFTAPRGARLAAAPPSVASTASTNSADAPPRRCPTARPSQNGAVDTTQAAIQVHRTGPPHVDHPVFSPEINALMRESGIRVVDGIIYAPEGINKFLKRSWELMLKTGKPYNSKTPPSTSSDDSDSTPPKRNQKKPAIARKKPAIKKPSDNRAKSPSLLLAPQNRLTLIDPNDPNTVFTGPPPNATEAEINAWADLWFRHHKFAPSTTPPPWVQNWIDNAEAYFTRQMAANAPSNNPDTTAATSDRIRQQLPAKRKSPTANAEGNHPSNNSETATTNDPPAAAEAETNTSNTEENATIVIDDQGDTAEDPIVIAESTSNSDNDSADEGAKST